MGPARFGREPKVGRSDGRAIQSAACRRSHAFWRGRAECSAGSGRRRPRRTHPDRRKHRFGYAPLLSRRTGEALGATPEGTRSGKDRRGLHALEPGSRGVAQPHRDQGHEDALGILLATRKPELFMAPRDGASAGTRVCGCSRARAFSTFFARGTILVSRGGSLSQRPVYPSLA